MLKGGEETIKRSEGAVEQFSETLNTRDLLCEFPLRRNGRDGNSHAANKVDVQVLHRGARRATAEFGEHRLRAKEAVEIVRVEIAMTRRQDKPSVMDASCDSHDVGPTEAHRIREEEITRLHTSR